MLSGYETRLSGRRLYQDLDDAVMEMYLSMLDHYTKATEYDSVLVSFIMVLSVRPDKTWETFVNLTPKLSAIMAISRLFISRMPWTSETALWTDRWRVVWQGRRLRSSAQAISSLFPTSQDLLW